MKRLERRTRIEQAPRAPEITNHVGVVFQPIFDLETQVLTSFEALARWQHPALGWVSPAELIPICEQLSVIDELSVALLSQSCRAARQWPDPVRLSFNVSPVQMCAPDAAPRLLAQIAIFGLDPRRFQVEVTETALASDLAAARRFLAELHQAGVRTALDDFGSGYASIKYLRELRFDIVKLDGALVRSITSDPHSHRLIDGVLAMCRAIGRDCVAEQIEDEQQIAVLQQLHCRYGQGFGLQKPMSDAEAVAFAKARVILLMQHTGALNSIEPPSKRARLRG